jgi:hypothetical protein
LEQGSPETNLTGLRIDVERLYGQDSVLVDHEAEGEDMPVKKAYQDLCVCLSEALLNIGDFKIPKFEKSFPVGRATAPPIQAI